MSAASNTVALPGTTCAASSAILRVGIARLGASPGLDDHLQTCFHQAWNYCRYQRHATLTGVTLARNTNDHDDSTIQDPPDSPRRATGRSLLGPPAESIREDAWLEWSAGISRRTQLGRSELTFGSTTGKSLRLTLKQT